MYITVKFLQSYQIKVMGWKILIIKKIQMKLQELDVYVEKQIEIEFKL